MHLYYLQLLQDLKPSDYDMHANFQIKILWHEDENLSYNTVFCDELVFKLSGNVITQKLVVS